MENENRPRRGRPRIYTDTKHEKHRQHNRKWAEANAEKVKESSKSITPNTALK